MWERGCYNKGGGEVKGFNPLCEAKKAEGRDRKGFVRLCINVEEILGHNINTKTSV